MNGSKVLMLILFTFFKTPLEGVTRTVNVRVLRHGRKGISYQEVRGAEEKEMREGKEWQWK